MKTATVYLKNLKIAPRKIRLLADLVRGQNTAWAIGQLKASVKKNAVFLEKLILAGEAAFMEKNKDINDKKDLYIKSVKVDGGPVLKRRLIMSRGRAGSIRKRSSHITLTISTKESIEKINQKEKII
ncbi:MAG: large subunit ribosomal protein L22 [Candidatus Berkelbacteria bacterium Licking1014_2]|uniref:Large ribosomal subunit protein uL22 n=1 Tax=Candidatus Berkelbacteria bacterium Licking1014_2 TaxID=2017146 RepID=A0A554LWV7_9BACT|nr:MAG: large subunit ribosomal protein L22 [Candidatus Berkelbacteria bacterium Licking1014_2]